jgi:hypothetical protein
MRSADEGGDRFGRGSLRAWLIRRYAEGLGMLSPYVAGGICKGNFFVHPLGLKMPRRCAMRVRSDLSDVEKSDFAHAGAGGLLCLACRTKCLPQ